MTFTFYGQSGFLITVAGHSLLFDPFITHNPLAKDIDISTIQADFMFLTHGHGDHVGDAVALAKQTSATVVAAPEVGKWLSDNGVTKVHPINHGGWVSFPFGKVKAVNAIHSSGMPDGSYGGNPLGFLFSTTEGDFYIAGDTALTMDMKLIPLWSQNLKFAELPIGGNYTMDVDDAVLAAGFVETKMVIGTHYNTFPIISIDSEKAKQSFAEAGVSLLLPAVGESIEL